MAVLKYHDGTDWEPVVSALQGPTGPTGVAVGLPTGGATGASLIKSSSTDYATEWSSNVGGLVHIETQTLSSGVSAVNFNNVFSTTYDTYLVTGYIIHSTTNAGTTFRLRNAGTDRSGTDYQRQTIEFFGGTSNSGTSNASTFQIQGWVNDTSGGVLNNYIYNPAVATKTGIYLTGGARQRARVLMGGHNVAQTHDGFSINSESGTWASGFVSVYGLVKS